MTQQQIPQERKKNLSDKELLEMAQEIEPEAGKDFLNNRERAAKEFMRGIKLI